MGETRFPLGFSEDRTSFKFFLNDVGILTSRLMGSVDLEIINGRTNINYGSVFEAAVAQELLARGYAAHHAVVLHDGNVEVAENRVYAPVYAAGLALELDRIALQR